jgi:hypothetical protein
MHTHNRMNTASGLVMGCLLLVLSALSPTKASAATVLIDIPGPTSSGKFGTSVTVLSNGNFVVTDPSYNSNRGAVYLYSPDRVLINQLTGGLVSNNVGGGGITVLTNGNYVVSSPAWSNSMATFGIGAVTWCSQTTGCKGTVSDSNSLIGSKQYDSVGGDFFGGVTALSNGNYIVISESWDNGSIVDAGAVTWGNGSSGTVGVVSSSNSLVGSTAEDQVGSDFYGGVTALTNGNYVVSIPQWDNGGITDVGAVVWGNGSGGTVGVVSNSNSLVGSSTNDKVGNDGVTELTNGNYLVLSSSWNNESAVEAGAVTWGNGTSGVTGLVSISNSLVGTGSNAENHGVTTLTNGNYVISSPYWTPSDSLTNFGAATWGNGTTGVSGLITASNSLVGSSAGDYVGDEVVALTNGNYVVSSPDAHAVTWGDGTSGVIGPVSSSNSLVSTSNVSVGYGGVFALSNGNYVVSSPTWCNEAISNVGAITWGNGTTGVTGSISLSNSLVGSSTYDSIGDGGVTVLTNGNYVVISTDTFTDGSGTVTWVDGGHITTGVVSHSNSLVGGTEDDQVGSGLWGSGVTALTNGNYVVSSPWWNNGSITDSGAITWGNGTNGTTGVVSASNSLVGNSMDDKLGSIHWDGGVTVLTNGNYVVSIPQWDNGSNTEAGAVAWGNGASGTTGAVSASNSLVGSAIDDQVGNGSFFGAPGVTVLPDGNYIVNSPKWKSGSFAGAVSWGNGTSGTVGAVSVANSLVNTSVNDETFNESTITVFPGGSVSMHFPNWQIGSDYGAVSLISGLPNITIGPVSSTNSVLGTSSFGGGSMVSGYGMIHDQLIVGRPYDNKVTILRWWPDPTDWFYLPVVTK